MGSLHQGINFTVFKGSKGGSIVEGTTDRDALQGDEVLLRITHSGLCGTDEHYRHSDQCLGHEGAGVVEELGPEASGFKVYISSSPISHIPLLEILN